MEYYKDETNFTFLTNNNMGQRSYSSSKFYQLD